VTTKILNKPLVGEINLTEMLDISDEVVRQVAKASNGQFIKDRQTMTGMDFITKYFTGASIRSYDSVMESRAVALNNGRVKKSKVKSKVDKISDYVVALFEQNGEFAITYRRVESAKVAFDFHRGSMVYKKDSREYAIVSNHSSREVALNAKNKLREELLASGKVEIVGILPV
jgi:hypothetical protein